MATKDNSPGLLSKVAMFVRNPTTNWSDLDQLDAGAADSAFSKQALKEMIERKRQNDFVRKREFDQLRKLRKRGAADLAAEVGRPSFFHSSLSSSTDDRASTLKKIDEIEAHMSKQWWKGKQEDETPAPRGVVPVPPTAKGHLSTRKMRLKPSRLSSGPAVTRQPKRPAWTPGHTRVARVSLRIRSPATVFPLVACRHRIHAHRCSRATLNRDRVP